VEKHSSNDNESVVTQTVEGDGLNMTKHINNKQILAVANVAKSEWQDIGIYLGFERQELSGYEYKFRDDLEERLKAVLFAWKAREYNPTVGKVVKACEDAKVGSAVRRALLNLIPECYL
jgi:hypothetical protein